MYLIAYFILADGTLPPSSWSRRGGGGACLLVRRFNEASLHPEDALVSVVSSPRSAVRDDSSENGDGSSDFVATGDDCGQLCLWYVE
jgi:hypothetical protein